MTPAEKYWRKINRAENWDNVGMESAILSPNQAIEFAIDFSNTENKELRELLKLVYEDCKNDIRSMVLIKRIENNLK
jgi:hypothetical protein